MEIISSPVKHHEIDYSIRKGETALKNIEAINEELHISTHIRLLRIIQGSDGNPTIQVPLSTLVSHITQSKDSKQTTPNSFYDKAFRRFADSIWNKYHISNQMSVDDTVEATKKSPLTLQAKGSLDQGLTMVISSVARKEIRFSPQGNEFTDFQTSYDGEEINDLSLFDTLKTMNLVMDIFESAPQGK